MTRQLTMIALLGMVLLMGACAPVIEVQPAGNEYVQNAYSRNFWWPNWQRVTTCWQIKDGYCPKEDTRVETQTQIAMEASGHKAAVGAVSQIPLAMGLGLGLAYQNAGRMTQSVTGNQAVKTNFESPGAVIK